MTDTAQQDGGPAFPQMRIWNAERAEYEDTQQYPGMSLRDWFAGQAMSALIIGNGADISALRLGAALDAFEVGLSKAIRNRSQS